MIGLTNQSIRRLRRGLTQGVLLGPDVLSWSIADERLPTATVRLIAASDGKYGYSGQGPSV